MKCPFELPVEKAPGGMFCKLRSRKGGYLAELLYHKDADYIVQAINSHEKFKIACARAYEGLCTNDLDACDEAIKLLDELSKITGKQ